MKKLELFYQFVGIFAFGCLLGSIVFGIIKLGNRILVNQEIEECLQLKRHSETVKGFYLLSWQKEMCDNYQVTINSPIYESFHSNNN